MGERRETEDRRRREMDEAMERLEKGTREVFDAGRWERYLDVMSRFHGYSANNVLLIAMQMPQATFVAGYNDWKRKFHRQVRKGEHGIRIIAPVRRKVTLESDDGDDGLTVERLAGFRLASTFDVSQTDGEPLPEITELLDGTVDRFDDVMAAIAKVAPVPVVIEDVPGEANGYFSPTDRKIAVQRGMAQAQTVKTAMHELAHSRMHDSVGRKSAEAPDRDTCEVQAESVAFVVARHYGIETGDYSFGYVASWAGSRELEQLRSSMDAIRRTAHSIIDDLDAALA